MPNETRVTHVTLPLDVVTKALQSIGERKINDAIQEWFALKTSIEESVNAQMASGTSGGQ